MGKVKITPAQVYIIGAVLTVIAAVVIYFALWKPSGDAFDAAKARYDTADATANKMPAAKQDRAKATQEVAVAEAKWRRYDREYMYAGNAPIVDISNLLVGMKQVWNEQVLRLQPKVENFLKADKTVQIVGATIAVPAPSADPNAIAKKAFVYDLGTVSVAGTFNNVLKHVERWNNFDRLVLTDNLTLTGNSPRLVGSYTLRCFEFTHGEKPGAAIPQASATAGGGGGFAGPGSFGPPPGTETGPPVDGPPQTGL